MWLNALLEDSATSTDEERSEQHQHADGDTGQPETEDPIGETAERRPLENRAAAAELGCACLQRDRYESGAPLQVIWVSCACALDSKGAGSGAKSSCCSTFWPGPRP